MAEIKYVSNENLLYVWQKIKLKLADKVDEVEGKGLSTNDFTDELKEKLLNAGNSSFSGDYNDLTNKPTLITEEDINEAINDALKDIQGISYSVVETLPTTGEAGVIYLVSNSGTNTNIYDEYIYVNENFEKIGTTEVDLSEYVKFTDLVELTNAEIDTIFAS